jgi:nucleoid DNA-binding protein
LEAAIHRALCGYRISVRWSIPRDAQRARIQRDQKNGEFVLPGFGKLVKQKRKARTGFNPKTQQKIEIPAKTVVKFRVAKAAKDAVLGVKK